MTRLPFPQDYRCPFGIGGERGAELAARWTENLLDDPKGGVPTPAGMILEPVQGEGGVIPAPDAWLRRMREITAARSIPLIADEVQTGVGRTGTFWAVEHSGIVPDVMVLSKAIGGCLPLAVIVYRVRTRRLAARRPRRHLPRQPARHGGGRGHPRVRPREPARRARRDPRRAHAGPASRDWPRPTPASATSAAGAYDRRRTRRPATPHVPGRTVRPAAAAPGPGRRRPAGVPATAASSSNSAAATPASCACFLR